MNKSDQSWPTVEPNGLDRPRKLDQDGGGQTCRALHIKILFRTLYAGGTRAHVDPGSSSQLGTDRSISSWA